MILPFAALSLAIVFSPFTVHAETPIDSLNVYNLDESVVVAGRYPSLIEKSARTITIIDSDILAKVGAQTVNDVLKLAAGVDVRQRGAMGMQTDISIRGGSFDQIALLLDGIPVSDPHTGHNAADFPVNASEIERIEIMEGPAARVYGTQSLVGAINIITRKPSTGAGAYVDGGSYGYLDAGAHAGLERGSWNNSLSGGFSRSDGYSRNSDGGLNSDFNSFKGFYKGGFTSKRMDLSWHAGISSKDFGSNTFYSPKYDNQFEHTLKSFMAVQGSTKGRLSFRPSLYWNRGQDRFELFRGDPSRVAFNHHVTNVTGLNLGFYVGNNGWTSAFGLELRNENILSTNLGEALSSPKKVPGYDAEYKASLNRTAFSAYADNTVSLGKFIISSGIDVSYNTGNKEGLVFCPGVDISYIPTDELRVNMSINTSSRMPTFTELYYSVGGHRADPNLKAEKMASVELETRYATRFVRATANVYYHMGRDMIDWIMDTSEGADAQWQSVNHARINTLGAEFAVVWDIPQLLGRDSFPVKTLSLSYSHIKQDKKEEENILSKYALEYLRNKLVASAKVNIWKGLWANLDCSYLDREGSYALYENKTDTGRTVDFSPYTLLDLRLDYIINPRYSLHVDAMNMLNKTYYDYGNIPQPGFWFRGGVKINL